MKKKIWISLIILFILPVLFFSCNKENLVNGTKINDFKSLSIQFGYPPAIYSTCPFWVWNDHVTKEIIDRQLADFKDKGIYEIFIHPRPGMITDYLSEDWFNLVKYSVEKAKVLGMRIWLYDENSFPSGFAGGHVLARMPRGYDPVVGLKLIKVNKLTLSDTNKYVLLLKKSGQSFTDITYSIRKYESQSGNYYAFSKWYFPSNQGMFAGGSYVDLLAFGITERFINTTMTGYEKYLGNELGKTIPGIFTDEPNINPEGGPEVIRYTPALFTRFESKYGYRLENYLPCLYEETGDWKNVRHDYYSLLLDMFISRWSKPWKAYTDSIHLIWTGHYWEHAWPNPQFGGDNMAMYEWHQYPGIDLLFNNENLRPDQFGNIRNVKELSSVANQLRKERTLSETYGGSGWELRFEDMKRNGDWEYVLGVNMMNQHLSYMTIKGARKRDFPQSMSYHAPWWENYRPLNEYYQRLSLALSSGNQINRILVLEPTTTAWMYYSPDQEGDFNNTNGKTKLIADSFRSLLSNLEKAQVEYDLGCEKIIANHGKIKDSEFSIGERQYNLIILPENFENLEKGVLDLLLKYVRNGGKVISLTGYPSFLDGNFSDQMPRQLKDLGSNWQNIDSLDGSALKELSQIEAFKPVNANDWGGRVFHQRKEFEDGSLYFFVNFDTSRISSIRFIAKGNDAVEMDPFSGKIITFPHQRKENSVEIQFQLFPSNSKLLFISKNILNAESPVNENNQVNKSVATFSQSIKRLEPNTISLDYCDLTVGGKSYKDMYFYNAADTVFKTYLKVKYGFNYNPWSVAVQYKKEILEKNHFDSTTGFSVNFPFYIRKGFNPYILEAVIESPELYRVKINNLIIKPSEGKWWLDRSFGVFDIAKYVKEGRNEISYTANPMNVLAEIESIYILGEFNLKSINKGWELEKPEIPKIGSWKTQGMPFYSHSVDYERKFMADSGKTYVVNLGKWNGTVVEIKVNGTKAGIIGWQPYSLDITRYVKAGENLVEVSVTGSLKNQLGPHHNNPVSGIVTPWSFFFAPGHQPSGAEYQMIDYGLFEDFNIMSN